MHKLGWWLEKWCTFKLFAEFIGTSDLFGYYDVILISVTGFFFQRSIVILISVHICKLYVLLEHLHPFTLCCQSAYTVRIFYHTNKIMYVVFLSLTPVSTVININNSKLIRLAVTSGMILFGRVGGGEALLSCLISNVYGKYPCSFCSIVPLSQGFP